MSVQQVRALSALVRVREVHVREFPLQCPWCVSLPVLVVRFFLVLHMYNRSVLQYEIRADTNEPRTNEIPSFLLNGISFVRGSLVSALFLYLRTVL